MVLVHHLGHSSYQQVWQQMQDFTAKRTSDTNDEIWLVEHPPVFTQGQAGKAEHILDPGSIPIIQSDRGGQVTYHGPGQIVAYVLFDLRRAKFTIRQLVDTIEQAIIATLQEFDIKAQARRDAPGVYVQAKKIASIGLRVRRGCSYHGLALNTAMDLTPFQRINPCGFKQLEVCQVQDFVPTIEIAELERGLCHRLGTKLN